jgi:sorbitol/mannitol transport system permease protein
MDGAGLIRTLRSIIVPIISAGIAATALICFIFAWSELLLANTLTSVIAGTAPVFLTSFVTSQGLFLAKVCAAATVVSLPVIIAGSAHKTSWCRACPSVPSSKARFRWLD